MHIQDCVWVICYSDDCYGLLASCLIKVSISGFFIVKLFMSMIFRLYNIILICSLTSTYMFCLQLKCCGVNNASDWINAKNWAPTANKSVPKSCCVSGINCTLAQRKMYNDPKYIYQQVIIYKLLAIYYIQ